VPLFSGHSVYMTTQVAWDISLCTGTFVYIMRDNNQMVWAHCGESYFCSVVWYFWLSCSICRRTESSSVLAHVRAFSRPVNCSLNIVTSSANPLILSITTAILCEQRNKVPYVVNTICVVNTFFNSTRTSWQPFCSVSFCCRDSISKGDNDIMDTEHSFLNTVVTDKLRKYICMHLYRNSVNVMLMLYIRSLDDTVTNHQDCCLIYLPACDK